MNGELISGVGEWRKVKANAVEQGMKPFEDTVGLADLALRKFTEVHSAIQPINPNDYRIVLDLMLIATHRLLLNALDLLIERQNLEAMAVLRPALEMAADAAKISRDPKLSRVWLRREDEEGAYNQFFKPQFQQGDPLSGPLYRAYKLTCNFGSHANANVAVMHADLGKKAGGGAIYYFLQDNQALRRQLIHFTVTVGRVVNVFTTGLKDLSKVDLEAVTKVWQCAMDVHKAKYRELFVINEKEEEKQ